MGLQGVGKTTLSTATKTELEKQGKRVVVIQEDWFIKDPEVRKFIDAEWDENHIRIDALRIVLEKILFGEKEISFSRYFRSPTRRVAEDVLDLKDVDIVIVEGLHVLSREKRLSLLGDFVDFALFLDAPREQIKEWRLQQENEKDQPRSLDTL